MNLTYQIDWETGIVKNKALLLKEEMWEKSFGEGNSTFEKYYTEDHYEEDAISTMMCFNDDELVGVLIFPELDSETMKMTINKQQMKFLSLGEVQLYVKPEYRSKGIASKMVKHFDKLLYEDIKDRYNEDIIYVLQATQRAVPVTSRNMTYFPVYNVFGLHPELLKSRIRSEHRFNNHKTKTLSEWKDYHKIEKVA